MQIVCVLVIVSGILTEIRNQYSIGVGRFLFGIAAGSITVYVPKYVEEVSPTKHKGTLGTYFQLFLTFGIFVGPLVALPIPLKQNCGIYTGKALEKCLEE